MCVLGYSRCVDVCVCVVIPDVLRWCVGVVLPDVLSWCVCVWLFQMC